MGIHSANIICWKMCGTCQEIKVFTKFSVIMILQDSVYIFEVSEVYVSCLLP